MDYKYTIRSHENFCAQRLILVIRAHLKAKAQLENDKQYESYYKNMIKIPDLTHLTNTYTYISKREISRLAFEIANHKGNFIHLFVGKTYLNRFRYKYNTGALELAYCIQYSMMCRNHWFNGSSVKSMENLNGISMFLSVLYCSKPVEDYITKNRGLFNVDCSLPDLDLVALIVNPVVQALSMGNNKLLISTILGT